MRKDKPNWDKWNLIDDAQVWKVAALSLDIDPDTVEIDMGDWVTRAGGKTLKDRIEILGANYTKIDSSANTLSMNGKAYCELNIPKFAKWAIEKNISIPDELKKRVSEVEQKSEQQISSSYQTELLKIQNLAIKEFFEPRKKHDPKKEVVKAWIISKGQESQISVSNNIADAIFTIIKPHDHNPKIRRD